MKVPLLDQISAGKALLSGDSADGRALEALWKTLLWIEKNPDSLKAAAELMKHDAVRAVYASFPDAKLAAIRDVTLPSEEEMMELQKGT
jgi:hypothetical protein